jgi:hypothetical protein
MSDLGFGLEGEAKLQFREDEPIPSPKTKYGFFRIII